MELTSFQRVCKLTGDLARRPGNVPRYLAHNLFQRRSPLDLALPWFSYAAIDFLERSLRPEMTVFEFGSGGSTLFFARRCGRVESVEDDPRWARLARERTKALGLTNSEVVEELFDFVHGIGFEESGYLAQVKRSRHDVIIVDGADNDYTIRPRCFAVAEEQVEPGGMIVVDDSWRYLELRRRHRARQVRVFESVGPARFGVTSTDVYFY